MTRGEIVVVAVRGRTLVDSLAAYVFAHRRSAVVPPWMLADTARDVVWNAQRVVSAAEKALGTRRRP